ncbi:MAG: ArnT family glycosyltransferase [Tepidisphaerales bacterium]
MKLPRLAFPAVSAQIPSPMTDAVDNPPPSRWTAVGLFLLFFVPFIPAVNWTEFSGGMENFNVGTAQEMVRRGNWLLPTLNGEIRTKKPPLATWMSAIGMKLTGSLPWGARLPNVLCTGLLAAATYYFGREIGGHRLGVIASLVGSSSFLVLQHAIPAQYDMPYAVCITLANLYLAKLALRGCWWEGCLGAGFWLGLAFMAKGPLPALLMTVAPFVACAFIRWIPDAPQQPVTPVLAAIRPGQVLEYEAIRPEPRAPVATRQFPSVTASTRVLAVLAGLGVLALVAMPWTIYVLYATAGRAHEWYNETTLRDERVNEEHSWWWKYVLVVPWFAPWALWYVVGLLALCFEKWRPLRRRMLLVVLMVGLPLLVMSFFPVRRPRYVLPLAAPLAVLAAWRIEQHFARPEAWKKADRLLVFGHGAIMTALAVGLPVAGMFFVRTVDGDPWYGMPLGFASLAIMAAVLALMWRRMADWRWHVGGSAVLMLMLAVLFLRGYKDSPNGRSPAKLLAARLLERYPGAEYYSDSHKGHDAPTELTIYLNSEVRRCANPAKLRASTRPQVLFVGTEQERTPDRPGWRLVDKQRIAKAWWYAMVRE